MYSSIQTGGALGMQTLDQCLLNLVRNRIVHVEEARARAQDKNKFQSTGSGVPAAGGA
jgi:twitching motility protein PilT